LSQVDQIILYIDYYQVEGNLTLSDDDDESSEEENEHVEVIGDVTTVKPLTLESEINRKKSKYMIDEDEELEVFHSVDNLVIPVDNTRSTKPVVPLILSKPVDNLVSTEPADDLNNEN